VLARRYNPEDEVIVRSIDRVLGEELIAAARDAVWAYRTNNPVALRRSMKRLKELAGE
jgi:hypothetical protein